MPRPAVILFGALLFVLLAWWSVTHHGYQIQENVELRVAQTLSQFGYDDVTAHADGRDLILTGSTGNASERLAAESRALEVPGVRRVDNQIVAGESDTLEQDFLEPYHIVVDSRAHGIYLSGMVDSNTEREWLELRARQAFPDLDVHNAVAVGSGKFPAGQFLAETGLAALTEMISGSFGASAKGIKLNGSVTAESTRLVLQQRMTAIAAQYQNFDVDSDLVIQEIEQVVQEYVDQTVVESEIVQTTLLEGSNCQDELDQVIAGEKIQFESEKSVVNEQSFSLLDNLASALQRCRATVEVGGHTDSYGDDVYNQYLSEQRAAAVREYLVDVGVVAEQLTVVGYGETQPVDYNTTRVQRARNRRIEFRVLEGQ